MSNQPFDPNSFRIQGADAMNEALDKYSSGSGAEFFSLKDNGDSAKVVFLHGDSNDLDTFTVHKVKIGDKDRYVACLSPQNTSCPFCSAGLKPTVRTFISLIDLTDGKVKLWDRGKNEIQTLLARIAKYGPLNNRVYEITRKGKKGDTGTTYDILPDGDPVDTRQFAHNGDLSRQEIIGVDKFVLIKSPDEMAQLLQQGCGNTGSNSSYGYAPQQHASGGYSPYNPPRTNYQPPQPQYQAPPQQTQYQAPPQQTQYQAPPQQAGGSYSVGYGNQDPATYQQKQANPSSQNQASATTYFSPSGPAPAPENNQQNFKL